MSEETIDFEKTAAKIDELLEKIKEFPEEQREMVKQLIDNLHEFHKVALVKLVKMLKNDPNAKNILIQSLQEPEIFALFLKYNIIREDKKTKVAKAIEHIKPYVHSHGGDVELVDVKDKTVIVRLKGACEGCSQVSFTLQQTILEAVKAYVPEIENIQLDKNIPVEAFIDLKTSSFIKAIPLSLLEEGKVITFKNENINAIITLWKGKIYAYKNQCAHQGLELSTQKITSDGKIICPWHGFEYCIESGECLTVNHIQLEPIPTKIKEEFVWLKIL